MTDFKRQYDEKLKAYEPHIQALPTLTTLIGELTRPRLRAFFQRSSILLGNVDKGKVRRAVYLAHGNGHVGNFAIANLDQIPNYATDPHGFIQQVLVPQIEFQKRLEQAVGLPGREAEILRQQVAQEISHHVDVSENLLSELKKRGEGVEKSAAETTKMVDDVRTKTDEASLIITRAEKFRERLEKLDSDARHSDSIERLVKAVRQKITDAEEAAEKISPLVETATAGHALILNLQTTAGDAITRIDEIELKANKILGLSSQAGLANSYINERKKLEFNKLLYTGIFYLGIGIMALVAAMYVIPAFENLVTPMPASEGIPTSNDIWQKTLILAIRSAILAPFVWAIIFTSNRVRKIETLELDYAEKAAASLAYHGYKSEMESDHSLLERLKSGLLVRFSEHPERLLRTTPPTTEIEAQSLGFRLKSKVGELSTNHEEKEGEAERT